MDAFEQRKSKLPGEWFVISKREDLNLVSLREIGPRYVFIPHWSWLVSKPITDEFECVCFHMTDVPYGRGGSPLQNLIVRGHRDTKVSALRMTEEIDAGPVYIKHPLSLDGSAQEIYTRASAVVFDMIEEIVKTEPSPQPQSGEPVHFMRRTPDQSELPKEVSRQQLYDFIRMLDAETYPHAFLDWGNFRLHFTDAEMKDGRLKATVSIGERDKRND